ncbi:MAG: GNAT family N-acetyltransferase [Parasporobacterium sp.]|nr:GNAT family N-acetyltransferase [Parasporobacterium sp.]
MEKIIHGKYINQGENLSQVLKIRKEIFGREEDEKDPLAVNLLVSLLEDSEDSGTIIGCGRLIFDLENFRFLIDEIGISESVRRRGYGEFALRALVDKVNQCGAEKVYVESEKLSSPEAEKFFRKMFFKEDPEEGAGFLSAPIDAFHTCCH